MGIRRGLLVVSWVSVSLCSWLLAAARRSDNLFSSAGGASSLDRAGTNGVAAGTSSAGADTAGMSAGGTSEGGASAGERGVAGKGSPLELPSRAAAAEVQAQAPARAARVTAARRAAAAPTPPARAQALASAGARCRRRKRGRGWKQALAAVEAQLAARAGIVGGNGGASGSRKRRGLPHQQRPDAWRPLPR